MGRKTKDRSGREVLAENIRRARAARRLTQEKLAELADLDRTYIGSLERAERNPSLDVMERVAKALGVTLHDLLDDDPKP